MLGRALSWIGGSWFGKLVLGFVWEKAAGLAIELIGRIQTELNKRKERARLDAIAKEKAKAILDAKTDKEFDKASTDLFN